VTLTCQVCGGRLRNPCPWGVVCDACFDARFANGYRKTPQFKQRRGGGPRLIERGRRTKVNTGIPGDWRMPPPIDDELWVALAGPEEEKRATIEVPQFWRRFDRVLVASHPWLRPAPSGERRFRGALFQIRYTARELLKELRQLPHPSKGIIDDLPGGWDLDGGVISANELLISENARNHGRARRWVAKIGKYGQTDLERSRVSGRSGRSHDGSLNFKYQIEVGFLDSGGWHVRKAGATGRPRGRPVKGNRGVDFIRKRIEQVVPGFDYQLASREERAELVAALLEPPQPVNRQALADLWNVNRSTVTRLNSLGRELLHQKCPKRGEVFSSPA
jgi:hypothetical protein